MEVKLNRHLKEFFASLAVGETYLDGAGVLCIKTGEVDDEGYGNVLVYGEKGWYADREYNLSLVTKVESTLIVNN